MRFLLVYMCLGLSSCFAVNVEKRLEHLERKFFSEISELKTELQRITRENIALTSENQQIKQDIQTLTNDLDSLKIRVPWFEQKYEEHGMKIDLANNLQTLFEGKSSKQYQPKHGTPDLKTFKRQTSTTAGTVAFHAVLSKNTCVHSSEIIKFDDINLNIGPGNGLKRKCANHCAKSAGLCDGFTDNIKPVIGGGTYSSDIGFYVVPVDGTFVFTWTVTSITHHYVIVELVVDGEVHGLTISDSDTNSDYHPATGTAVIQLTSGQQVYLRMKNSDGCMLVSNKGGSVLTTLSGWRLG